MQPKMRRQIVYDVFVDLGKGPEHLQSDLTRKQALEAKKLFRDVQVRPRIVHDTDLEHHDRASS